MTPQAIVYCLQNDEEEEHTDEFAAHNALIEGIGVVGIGIVI
jgi:hypothetical protein